MRPARSDDGLRVLSIKDIPPAEWGVKGVVVPAPQYSEEVYNTTYCEVNDSENELFQFRMLRVDPPMRETALMLQHSLNVNKVMNDEQLIEWLDQRIQTGSRTQILNLKFFAKYQPKTGFKVSIDGVHGTPQSFPYCVVSSLNPPASLYQQVQMVTNDVHLVSSFDFESPVRSFHYLDGFKYYKDIPADPHLTMILDIRSIEFIKGVPRILECGWAILPIFFVKDVMLNQAYVRSGIYQVPVFKGPVLPPVVHALSMQSDPYQFLDAQAKASKSPVKYLEGMSVIVRLLDTQREGHFSTTYDFNRFSSTYLPRSKLEKFVYNSAVDQKAKKTNKFRTIIPRNDDEFNFQKKISNAFVQKFGLSQFVEES